MMDDLRSVSAFLAALALAREEASPFRHWLLRGILAPDLLAGLAAWPHPAPSVRYALGRREEHNATRRYVDAEAIRSFPPARALAETFQNARTVAAIEARCDIDLAGTSLRIEYAQDRAGFWLEPHTDIGVKAFTMFVYLAAGERPHDWGTDLYFDRETHAKRLPFEDNSGTVFVPGETTWHGFEPRPIDGVRRSLIVNYVTAAWRNRHELAYPDSPVG